MSEQTAENDALGAWWVTSDESCHMAFPHGHHLWDTEDRVQLRYTCRGVIPPVLTAEREAGR